MSKDSKQVSGQEKINLLKNQEDAIKLFSYAPMKKTFNMELAYNEVGAKFTMPFNDKFTHAFKSIHGGVLSTLLDNAGWFTAQPHYNNWINTIDLQVQFIKPTANSTLFSQGRIVKVGKNISFTEMEIIDQDGHLIAKGTASFAITNKKINFENLG